MASVADVLCHLSLAERQNENDPGEKDQELSPSPNAHDAPAGGSAGEAGGNLPQSIYKSGSGGKGDADGGIHGDRRYEGALAERRHKEHPEDLVCFG